MLKREKKQFVVDLNDENNQGTLHRKKNKPLGWAKKSQRACLSRSVKMQFKTLELGFKPM